MRKILAAGLVTLSMAAAASAHATAIGITIEVDGVPVDTSGLVIAGSGVVSLVDVSNPYFNSISVTSTGAPATPDPNFGTITINASAIGAGTHTLTLLATQTDLTGGGFGVLANTFTYNALVGPANVSTSIGQNYVDPGDIAYQETILMASTPNEGLSTVTYASPVIDYSPTPMPLFSETEVYNFTFTGPALVASSAEITGVPEPISLAILGSGLIGLGAVRRRRTG